MQEKATQNTPVWEKITIRGQEGDALRIDDNFLLFVFDSNWGDNRAIWRLLQGSHYKKILSGWESLPDWVNPYSDQVKEIICRKVLEYLRVQPRLLDAAYAACANIGYGGTPKKGE